MPLPLVYIDDKISAAVAVPKSPKIIHACKKRAAHTGQLLIIRLITELLSNRSFCGNQNLKAVNSGVAFKVEHEVCPSADIAGESNRAVCNYISTVEPSNVLFALFNNCGSSGLESFGSRGLFSLEDNAVKLTGVCNLKPSAFGGDSLYNSVPSLATVDPVGSDSCVAIVFSVNENYAVGEGAGSILVILSAGGFKN